MVSVGAVRLVVSMYMLTDCRAGWGRTEVVLLARSFSERVSGLEVNVLLVGSVLVIGLWDC